MYLSNDLVVFDPGDDTWPAPYRAWEMAAAAKLIETVPRATPQDPLRLSGGSVRAR